MFKLCVATVGAVLCMASASVYAEEVKLNDQDRMELRNRADSLSQGNMLGRDRGMTMRSADHSKMHRTKKHSRKHARARRT
jgi:hypothetical protein